ncbi:MAG: hypothetical protein GY823_07305 [Flavobacteriaceae bacterium]|nr:hypothetical protein [Flavobacteriaceae bacterium]
MFYYHISYLSLSVVTFLLVLVFFKEKPKEGYGYLGDDKSFVNREMVTIKKFLTTCKSLFKMKIFVKFLLIIAIARGSIITIFGINHIFFKNLDLSTVN